jgi:hypothetical protein
MNTEFKNCAAHFLLGALDTQMQTLIESCEIDKDKVAHTDSIPIGLLGVHLGGIMSTLTMLDAIEFEDTEETKTAKAFCNNLASQVKLELPFKP